MKVRFAYPSSNQNSDAASASGWLRSSGSTTAGLPSELQLAVTSVIRSSVLRGSCFQVRSIGTQNQEVLVPVLAAPSGQPGAKGGGMEDGRSMLSLGSRHPHGQAARRPALCPDARAPGRRPITMSELSHLDCSTAKLHAPRLAWDNVTERPAPDQHDPSNRSAASALNWR
jgi:hypothetical protein